MDENSFLDVHNLSLHEAWDKVSNTLKYLHTKIQENTIKPNFKDGVNHILKIDCGKGIHSSGKAILKYKIPKFLVSSDLISYIQADQGYDFKAFEKEGLVLVRLQK